mgnify:CR=1 FL=1
MGEFKVGDKARVKYVRTSKNPCWKVGAIVTVYALEDLLPQLSPSGECTVVQANGIRSYPTFDQLEPITEEKTTWEAVQEITNWNPEKANNHEQH